MSTSSKFDLSSSSPDRPLYTSGQRGSYAAASLDRSSSFRESMESPILSSVPNMPRNSTTANQGDVLSFLQCLRFDPKSMIGDHKLNRPVDFKRLTASAIGIPLEDSQSASSKGKLQISPSLEDLRRLKTFLGVSCSKARERTKIFSEASSVIIKCFPSTPSRKRSRLDALSNDRSNTLFPNDRTVSGMGIGKMGIQNHASTSGFELEQQKTEERTKSSIPNKRTRTSMVDSRSDMRASTPVRPSLNIEKDRETLRLPNSNAGQGEDRTLPMGVESWEKSKMKKKRSGIKQDVSANLAATKPIEGYRDTKQGLQQRHLNDTRPRLGDTHGFRPGASNGGVGVGKADGTSVHIGMRSSIRADPDNSPLHDRRDRPTGSEKERVNLKAVNKSSAREDFSSGSPTSSTKMNATARAPRSSAGLLPKLPQAAHRATAASDWEVSQCTNKLPAASGVNNRKHSVSARSSSPPVAQWAGQRHQISRTARRTNFSPIVPSSDEMPTSDAITDVMGTERRLPANSPVQVKLKSESFSSALSESEESGAAETKSKDKNKKTDEMDEKVGLNVQKMSTLLLPPRKNKAVNGEDHGDGIRRQGRTGRTFTSGRSHAPLAVEKLGNAGTAKQLRSSRLGFDKSESKTGRPPTRKLSDRKAYARQKHTTVNAPADFLVGSDDGHEELLAATNAVINPGQALSSSLWKEMEPYFRYISDMDLVYMKQQIAPELDISTPAPLTSDLDNTSLVSNGFELSEVGQDGRMPKEIPLYQRLMAALIPEEGDEKLCYNGNDAIRLDTYESVFEHEGDMELGAFSSQMLRNSDVSGHMASNGFRSTADMSITDLDHMMPDNSILCIPESGMIPKYNRAENGLLPDQSMMASIACSEDQYMNMSINERLVMELQSVGIYPEEVPALSQTEDEEISKDISALYEKYQEQVLPKKGWLGKLLNSASEAKELQEMEFEKQALDKLVGMAYEKYMTCWGPNAHGMKSASGKMAKQAALAFVRRTLERYREFELTGKSCFGERLYIDRFLSGTSRLGDGQPVDTITNGESSKLPASNSGCSAEIRASAPLGTHHSPLSEVFVSANLASENYTGKEGAWSNKVKTRELSLVDVGGSSFASSAKGKRSDREGKGSSSREVSSRNGTAKIGRPAAAANVKGERKSKAKPKQKTTQLSASNSLVGKKGDQNKANFPSVPISSEMNARGIDNDNLEILEDPIDLSALQLPGMDDLGDPDDFGGQGQDIGSWLNIDDDGLQDDDFMGLEIPMDDLSDLKMIV